MISLISGYDAVVTSRDALIAQGTLSSNIITISSKRLFIKGVISLFPGESITLSGSCVLQGSGYTFGSGTITYVSGGFAGPVIRTSSGSFGTLISGLRIGNPSINSAAVGISLENTHRAEGCGIGAVTGIEIPGNCFVLNNYINPFAFGGPGSSALNAFKFITTGFPCENNRISGNLVDLASNTFSSYNSFIGNATNLIRTNISDNFLAGSHGINNTSTFLDSCNIQGNQFLYVGTTSGSFLRISNNTSCSIVSNTMVNNTGTQSYFIDTSGSSLESIFSKGGRIIGNTLKAGSSSFTHSFTNGSFTPSSSSLVVRGNFGANTAGDPIAFAESTLK